MAAAQAETTPAPLSERETARPPGRRQLLLYSALAGLNVVTVVLAVWLSDRTLRIYDEGVRANDQWSHRLDQLDDLRRLAGAVGTPASDVFDSGDAAFESGIQAAMLRVFEEALADARRSVPAGLGPEASGEVLRNLAELDHAVDGMVAESQQIFSRFAEGQPVQAAAESASLQREYGRVLDAHGRLTQQIRDAQKAWFAAQQERAAGMRRHRVAVALLVVVMLAATLAYGRRLYRQRAAAEDERARSLAALEDAGRELESRVAERTAELAAANEALKAEIAERERTETRLRAMSAALENALEGIAQIGADGRYASVNPAYAEMSGYRPEELLGEEWRLTVHADDIETAIAAYDRMRALGQAECEMRGLRRDGSVFHQQLTLVQAWDERDRPAGHYCLIKDVTERRRAEDALRTSEERFHLVARATNDIVWDRDLRTGSLWWNETMQTLFGYPPERVGEELEWWLERIHPEDRDRVHAGIEAFLASAESAWTGEYRFQRDDGSYADVLDRGHALRDEGGRAVRMIGSMMDISAGKEAKEASARLASIVESSGDAIVGESLDRLVTSWNAAAQRLYGYSAEEVLGRPAWMVALDPAQEERILERVAAGERLENFETARVRKDGTRVDVSLTVSAIRDAGGRLVGFSSIARDVTERRRVEEQLRLAKEAAEAASRAKSEFLANMSHEIRTPMNGILGMTELLLATPLTTDQREYLEIVRGSADTLLEVINGILDFSKIEAGRLELDLQPFSLREGVGDTIKTLALRAHEKGLELALRIAPDVPDALVGDLARLRQVLVNLVGNAIKFTPAGEVVVEVQCEPPGAAPEGPARPDPALVRFIVRDTGIGISPEKQRIVFDPFTQADSSTSRTYGGTGLGLAISSQLVRLMGGAIELRSEVGRGSTFTFTLPFAVQAPGAPVSRAEPAHLEGLRVLVVDDNRTNRRILEEMLAGWRMQPVAAADGETALVALERARRAGIPYPLVILDSRMPDLDGFAIAERIRSTPGLAGTAIMMLSSDAQADEARRCGELGIAVHVTKPIKQSDLLEAILTAMGSAAPGAIRDEAGARAAVPRESEAAGVGCRLVTDELGQEGPELRILLAEDNLVNQRVAVRLLESRGHSVTVASNGREALAILREGAFDLALMDVQMPEMDGFEATAAIRAQEQPDGPRLPIVALTAHAMKGDRERCLVAGMDGYVPKPVRSEELFGEIERVLGAGADAGLGGNGARITAAPQDAAAGPPADRGRARPDLDVLDREELLRRVDGDRDLLREIVDLFAAEVPQLLARIEDALRSGDSAALQRASHTLLGAIGNFCAPAAADAARRVGALAPGGEPAPGQAARATLEAELARLQEALAELVQEVPA